MKALKVSSICSWKFNSSTDVSERNGKSMIRLWRTSMTNHPGKNKFELVYWIIYYPVILRILGFFPTIHWHVPFASKKLSKETPLQQKQRQPSGTKDPNQVVNVVFLTIVSTSKQVGRFTNHPYISRVLNPQTNLESHTNHPYLPLPSSQKKWENDSQPPNNDNIT